MKGLTDRQRQLLQYIEDHLRIHGFPPSIREMAEHMDIRSTNGVNDHLKALEKKGYIQRGSGLKSRAISLLSRVKRTTARRPEEPVVAIPILFEHLAPHLFYPAPPFGRYENKRIALHRRRLQLPRFAEPCSLHSGFWLK